MEIAFRVLSSLFIVATTSILGDILYLKFSEKEKKSEEEAKLKRTVKLDKRISIAFIALLIFVNIVGILIVALPKVVTEYLGFNYVVTLCVWWIPVIFSGVVCGLASVQATYDEEKITVKRLFAKPKEYFYRDITYYSKIGNLKVVTANGSFTLFNALSGAKSLREFIQKKLEDN